VAHEADPSPDGKFMFVTDERGGGVVPGGASCATGIDNPYGNGGMHVIDISDPANPTYALNTEGEKAVFISEEIVTAPTFCTIHVMEQIPGENRIVMAWYSQGIKIVDWDVADDGTWSFEEVAFYNTPGNAIWAAEPFRIEDNADGTRTYFIMTSDISRGVDVVKLTLEPNPLSDHTPTDRPRLRPGASSGRPAPARPGGSAPPAPRPRPRPTPAPLPATGTDFALLGFAGVALLAAAGIRRSRYVAGASERIR
jgi:hypothetical protein